MSSDNYEKVAQQITVDLGTSLFKLLQDYPGYEAEMCRLMTAQLGSLIAVASKDPEKALLFYAERLAKFHWQEVRADYFANTLGVDTTRPTIRKVKTSDDTRRESILKVIGSDPKSQKPD